MAIPYFSELKLEPWSIDTPDEKMIGRLIHRGLLKKDQNGLISGDIAGAYEVRGLTYTFYIDPAAEFHSGKEIDAADVAYSMEALARSPRLTSASSFVMAVKGALEYRHRAGEEMAGIFLIDRKTVSITLSKPFPAFEEYLAGPGGYIIPKAGIAPTGGNIDGAGPYKIKWRNSASLALEPFDRELSQVFLDSLIFMKFNNVEEAALSMELGRLDLIPVLGEPSPKFISTSSHLYLTGKTFCSAVLGFNSDRGYQKDSRFSKALSFLLDRESIIRVILGGSAALPQSPAPGFDEASVDYDYIAYPDSAEHYFNRIGKLPESMTLYVDSRYPVLSKVSRYISGQLGSRGIKVVEKKVDLSYVDENRVKSEMDMYLSYYNPVSDNPDCLLYPMYSDKLAGQSNYLYYNDYAFQSFLENLRSETDTERRRMLSYGLTQSLANEPPAIVLYEPYLLIISKTDIAGFKISEQGYVDFRGAFIETGR
jgi:peptide/nickel transport system substrate-binding protein